MQCLSISNRWCCGSSRHISNPDSIDWTKCARFAAYRSLFLAPVYFGRLRFVSTSLLPVATFRSSLCKTAIEQLTFVPATTCTFLFGLTYMETLDAQRARREVAEKCLSTQKVRVDVHHHKKKRRRSAGATGQSFQRSISHSFRIAIESCS